MKLLLWVGVIFLVVSTSLLGSAASARDHRKPIIELWFGRNNTVRLPLVWGRAPSTAAQKALDRKLSDPLVFGFDVITALSDRRIRREFAPGIATRFKEFMVARDQNGIWLHKAYESYPDGWDSAMDFASMSIVAFGLYHALGDERYLRDGEALIAQMIRPIHEGGANHGTPKTACWFSEYAWPWMKSGDETFVLNGAMFALLSLETYAKLDPKNQAFKAALDCHVKSLGEMRSRFVYADGAWGRYMLHPSAPLHTHYAIFEISEFDALYAISGRQIYADMAQERRDRFARNFHVYRKDGKFFFSVLGVPHPTIPDIYQTKLIFRDKRGKVVGHFSTLELKGESRYFLRGDLPETASTFDLIAFSSSDSIRLIERGEFAKPALLSKRDIVATSIQPNRDMRPAEMEGCYIVDAHHNEADQGRLNIEFAPVALSDFNLFALDVDIDRPANWGIGLTTREGRHLFRYLDIPKDGGRKIIPISRLGFADQGKPDDLVVSATIYLYTKDEKPYRFCLRRLPVFAGYYAFGEYVSDQGFHRLVIRE